MSPRASSARRRFGAVLSLSIYAALFENQSSAHAQSFAHPGAIYGAGDYFDALAFGHHDSPFRIEPWAGGYDQFVCQVGNELETSVLGKCTLPARFNTQDMACTPTALTGMRVIAPVTRSLTKASASAFVSPATRLVCAQTKPT